MARIKGSKNKKTLAREAAKNVAAKRAAAAKTALPIDRPIALDSLGVMEETMRHFYFLAKIEESLGETANWKMVDETMERAAKWAKEVAIYRHARLSAMKLAGDSNNPLRAIRDDITADELRAEIIAKLEKLGLFVTTEPPSTKAQGIPLE
jgi:hypothetical protein